VPPSETTLGALGYRSLSLEGPNRNQPWLDLSPVDLGTLMEVEHVATPRDRSGFKIVCEDCGSLSIQVADPVTGPGATSVHCGRCGVVRGTLAELHDLARRGTDVFEF
jgi:hypothetical protein